MKRSFLYVVILLIFPIFNLNAQSPDLKETFLEAESYFLFEEYNEALPLYLKIHRAAPDNNNINYKIGICFLNDPYQKEKSIRYLQLASKDINRKFKENNFKEKTAPLEAFFYLGNAYLVNNDIDRALENYKYFREILNEKVYDVDLVEEQIKICEQARYLMTKPVDYDRKNLNEIINSRFADINPIISGNGKRLVYVSKRQFYDATFFSEKIDGEWQAPRNIIPELGVDGDVYPSSLSWDGNTMIIYRNDEFVGNLYISKYIDDHWTKMEKLGSNINTKYWESHGSFSKDGNTIYFTSNRKDGFGGLDIYKSEKQSDGTWGIAVNLGGTINTRYNEETPFITENEKILYFSSYGHYNMGGYDVFFSRIDENGNWGIPVNLGYPINTTDNDLFFFPVNNGDNAYYSQYLDGGFGKNDIYYLAVYSENNPRMYMITGAIAADKGIINEADNLTIYLINRNSGDTIQVTKPDLTTQQFELKAPKGEYDLLMQSTTFNDLVQKISINNQTEKSGISITDSLTLETKPYVPKLLTGEQSRIVPEDTVYNVQPGKKLNIKLKLEKGSTLYADHYLDTIQISSDTFNIEKRRFVYEMIPEPGENIVDFTMIEENGDKSIKRVIIHVENYKSDTENQINGEKPDITVLNIPASENDSIKKLIQEKIDKMSAYASGDLKDILLSINPDSVNLLTEEDIYNYLSSQGADSNELNELKAVIKANNDTGEMLKLMLQHSDGELHQYLKTLDTDALGIKDAKGLINHLREAANSNGFSDKDINDVLKKINTSPPPIDKTLSELISYAEGDLEKYLQNIDLSEAEIYTPKELLDHLIEEAGDSYAPELLISVLTDMVSDRSLESFYNYLLANGSESISNTLKGLNMKKEGVNSISELISYILKNTNDPNLTEEELQMLIINLMADFTIAPILDADPIMQKKGISAEFKIAGGLLLTGLLIFILLFFRKKKKEEETN